MAQQQAMKLEKAEPKPLRLLRVLRNVVVDRSTILYVGEVLAVVPQSGGGWCYAKDGIHRTCTLGYALLLERLGAARFVG